MVAKGNRGQESAGRRSGVRGQESGVRGRERRNREQGTADARNQDQGGRLTRTSTGSVERDAGTRGEGSGKLPERGGDARRWLAGWLLDFPGSACARLGRTVFPVSHIELALRTTSRSGLHDLCVLRSRRRLRDWCEVPGATAAVGRGIDIRKILSET